MLANLLRVVGTVLGTMAFGMGTVTDEPVHTLVGLSVYVVACLGLLAVARALGGARTGTPPPAAPAPAG
jgi:exosortase/archaeosortase family protein